MPKNITFVFIVFLVCILTGCKSIGNVSDDAVLNHQREVLRLEERNRQLEERFIKYDTIVQDGIGRLELIGERAGRIGTTADELIELFGQYHTEVLRLIEAYRALQSDN